MFAKNIVYIGNAFSFSFKLAVTPLMVPRVPSNNDKYFF